MKHDKRMSLMMVGWLLTLPVFEDERLSYKYLIETSEDGSHWTTHTDKRAEFPVAVSPHRDAGEARARFVRITITGCQRPENGAGLYSFQVF